MYHDFESHAITRRSFLKGAGAGGSAGRGAAAAGGQQTGCAHSACALEEAAAVKLMRFKIDTHWNLILPDLYFPIF